jgi:hypothetical protein
VIDSKDCLPAKGSQFEAVSVLHITDADAVLYVLEFREAGLGYSLVMSSGCGYVVVMSECSRRFQICQRWAQSVD